MRIEAGQVAVVTGAASGIGFALAERLGQQGVGVILVDVRPAVKAAAAQLARSGVDAYGVVADVRRPEHLDRVALLTLDLFGRVDLVCNNAGVTPPRAPMWEQDLDTWSWLVEIKLLGVVHGVRTFAPILLERGVGHILNTASVGGLMPLPDISPYNATMHAVVGMTETLNLELRSRAPSVGATVLTPGRVATALVANSATLRPSKVQPGGAGVSASVEAEATGVGANAADVAESALAAIAADRVHVPAGDEVAARARDRMESLLAELEW
jgi:NAD(P)-dependent dehydrogenase (short-subunit alcohol dehydrogenase family)